MLDLNGSRKTWVIGVLCAANAAYLLTSWKSEALPWFPWTLFDFQLPKVICFSPAEMAIPIVQLAASLSIIVAICAACQQARKAVDANVSDSLMRTLFLEAIAAADLCGCCFELIIVADNFGVWTYAVCLFLLTIWWGKVWGDATACPYTHLEDVVMGKTDTQLALMKTWAELTGGVLIFRLIQAIWSLELIDTHDGRSTMPCTADLQVAMAFGAAVEGFATCLCQLIGKAIADVQPRHSDIVSSFIGTALVVAGPLMVGFSAVPEDFSIGNLRSEATKHTQAFNITGGYFNPVLATALKFGCKGHSVTEHVVVYWGGACLGSALSVFLYHHTQLKQIVSRVSGVELKNDEDDEFEKEE